MKEIEAPDFDLKAEVKKCKTMEDVVGKNGLMQRLLLVQLISTTNNYV
ncbi:MAG: hypothetical protein ACREV6_06170 [Clostridium sp.]